MYHCVWEILHPSEDGVKWCTHGGTVQFVTFVDAWFVCGYFVLFSTTGSGCDLDSGAMNGNINLQWSFVLRKVANKTLVHCCCSCLARLLVVDPGVGEARAELLTLVACLWLSWLNIFAWSVRAGGAIRCGCGCVVSSSISFAIVWLWRGNRSAAERRSSPDPSDWITLCDYFILYDAFSLYDAFLFFPRLLSSRLVVWWCG